MSLRHVNGVLIGVLVYVILQLLVGILVSRGIRSEADYLVAGRRIGLGLATFSMFATWFGAESCVSAAGKFYAEGLAGGATDPFGYSLALFLMGLLFAVPLWRRGLTTLADLFRQRYSSRVERFAAVLMAPTSVFWAAAQIRAFGQVLHASSDWNVVACVTLAAVVVILYTCTGGLLADVMTDLVQGLAIIVGLVALLVVLGLHPSVSLVEAWRSIDPEKLRLFGGPANSAWATLELWTLTVCGSLVAQEVAARILATKSPGIARRATLWGGGLYLVIGLIPAFLGLIAPQFLPHLAHPDQVLPRLAEQYLPRFVFILFAGALVSAILSTVDSTLLAASSLVSHNLIVSLQPGMSERNKVRLARGGVVIFGLAAYALALGADSIFDLVQQANGIGSAGVFVLLVFGLFSRRGGVWSGLATLMVGLGVWAYGTYVKEWTCAYLISLGAALVCFLVVSTWDQPVPRPTPSAPGVG